MTGVAPKPAHLGKQYGLQFSDRSVAEAYQYRLPYPPETFAVLEELATADTPRRILDIGCGSGDLSLGLLDFADELDAVDISAPMMEAGRRRPRGDDPRLNWVLGAAETAPLRPPYSLITAGESLHWMEWAIVMPRLAQALAPGAVLAICGRVLVPPPWAQELSLLLGEYSSNRDFRPTNLVDELTSRRLFSAAASRNTAPQTVERSVDAYVESIHSSQRLLARPDAP